jgi:hypothetical protein
MRLSSELKLKWWLAENRGETIFELHLQAFER